jgi:integrase/recombinase XerC
MRYPPHPLTRSQAKALIGAAASGQDGLRNAAQLTILYRTGMRCAESCSLDMGDISDLDNGAMVVRVAKPKGVERGVLPREIGIDQQASRQIKLWLRKRGRSAGPVFVTSTGARVSPAHLRRLIPKLARQCGIERRVHPHAFRHTFARELYDEKLGVVEIMLALGHSSLKTTQKYLRSIGGTEVVALTAARGEW